MTCRRDRLWLLLQTADGEQRWMDPADHAEASRSLRAWIEENGYGQSDLGRGCGELWSYGCGELLARVSYNGKVWDTRPYPQCECLYNPCAS